MQVGEARCQLAGSRSRRAPRGPAGRATQSSSRSGSIVTSFRRQPTCPQPAFGRPQRGAAHPPAAERPCAPHPPARPPHQVWPPQRLADAQQRVGGGARHHEVLGGLLRSRKGWCHKVLSHSSEVGHAAAMKPVAASCRGGWGRAGWGAAAKTPSAAMPSRCQCQPAACCMRQLHAAREEPGRAPRERPRHAAAALPSPPSPSPYLRPDRVHAAEVGHAVGLQPRDHGLAEVRAEPPLVQRGRHHVAKGGGLDVALLAQPAGGAGGAVCGVGCSARVGERPGAGSGRSSWLKQAAPAQPAGGCARACSHPHHRPAHAAHL